MGHTQDSIHTYIFQAIIPNFFRNSKVEEPF